MPIQNRLVVLPTSRRVACAVVTAIVAICLAGIARADDGEVRIKSKIGGLPVGLVKEAFGNSDTATRNKLVGLLADRITRNNGSRNQFLAADVTAAAALLAPYANSDAVLSAAMGQTNDIAIRDKVAQIVAAIGTARSAAP